MSVLFDLCPIWKRYLHYNSLNGDHFVYVYVAKDPQGTSLLM